MKKRVFFYIKALFLCAFVSLCAYFILKKPSVVSDGIKSGLSTVGNVLLPTLFPFMTLACFIENSGVSRLIGKLFSFFTRVVFRLPEEASASILMSFIGGYPVGAKMTDSLLKEGKITKAQAARMYLFCINGGPAFILSTVGAGLLGSVAAGAALFCSVTLSSLVIGFASGFLLSEPVKKSERKKNEKNSLSVFDAVTKSASQATSSMLSISVYVLVFSAICQVLKEFDLSDNMLAFLFSVFEVTNGVLFSFSVFPLPVIAAIIGFGGLCVHFQVMNGVIESGLKIKYFYASRLIHAALSSGICRVYLYLFPVNISVVSSLEQSVVLPYSVSLPCCIALAFMSVCLIFDIAPRKKV